MQGSISASAGVTSTETPLVEAPHMAKSSIKEQALHSSMAKGEAPGDKELRPSGYNLPAPTCSASPCFARPLLAQL